MRKFYFLAIIALLAFTNKNIKAQNSDHRWAVGVYMNWIDFDVSYGNFKFPTAKDFQGKKQMIPSEFSLARFISPSFNVVGTFASNKFDVWQQEEYKYMRWLRTNKFWDGDASIEYKFANGYILKESSWFSPYASAGVGLTNLNNTSYIKGLAGLGADFWVLPSLALNVHGSVNIHDNITNYLHLSTGVKFRFGARDADKDGVTDKKDLCPTEFGLKELQGCPDKDADGIADKDDACPDVAGPKEINGCPDTDGDGVLDKDDLCPTEAGSKDLGGCPDKDGDKVADKDDKCPDVAGLPKFAGCPDKDGDGIPDKDDKCPDVAGVAANNGCPEVKVVAVSLPGISKVLYFNIGHSSYKGDYSNDLNEVVTFMQQNADAKLNIDGYADETGSVKFNIWLSERRAAVVIKYLTGKGVAADRLIKTAYGKSMPVADNNTADGRGLNRRVEIKTVK